MDTTVSDPLTALPEALSTRHAASASPRVSVIMATFNGAAFVRQSISSLLAQTFSDFEIIVVDDCSTDATPDILRSITDPRLRVLRNERNLNVVESRNRCFASVTGDYVAMLDHDDISRPTRLAKQVAYLDSHPGTVLIGTAAHTLKNGRIAGPRLPGATSPALIGWLLLVANPLVCSSVMFRAEAARKLQPFMRADYTFADDYDLYHRLKGFGAIARIDEPLTLYRLHAMNTFRKHEDRMTANAVRVLAPEYEALFGSAALETATLIVEHLSAGKAVTSTAALQKLHAGFRRLTDSFLARDDVSSGERQAIMDHADELWQRAIRLFTRHSGMMAGEAEQRLYAAPAATTASTVRRLFDQVPFQKPARRLARNLLDRPPENPPAPQRQRVNGVDFTPMPVDASQPPTLFVVVDTEAEFDWSRPFERGLTSVHAIEQVGRGQAVFDRYGLRPIYVVDYPIATEARSVAILSAIHARGGCEIGAHLHPWTTPPFAEEVTSRNSYPGNLPPWLEREKLAHLIAAIEANFGIRPVFYKAGRYGFGPGTASALAQAGIKVDLSILPGADLRRQGGPDFRALEPRSYRVDGHDLVTVPMTRSPVGLLPPLGTVTEQLHRMKLVRRIPLKAALAHTRVVDTITLTPEGVTADEQIRLIRALLKRGTRQFVLHYHSPSLEAGHTSYVRNEAEVKIFVQRIEAVCRFFFETLGGMPGFPADLIQ